MHTLKALAVITLAAFLFPNTLCAQENLENSQSEAVDDIEEITVTGQASWAGHEGIDAFLNGDYQLSEIIFEKEFISLKRAENGRYNAASDAALSIDRAGSVSQNVGNSTASSNSGPSSGAASNQAAISSTLAANSSGQRKVGRNILNDGKLTYYDFALTKYMSGLSEIKLGKYDEAKKSLETSLHHYKGNSDARMRVGLLYLMEDNYDKAADHLEELERRRMACKKINCDKYQEILDAASTLAAQITAKLRTSQ